MGLETFQQETQNPDPNVQAAALAELAAREGKKIDKKDKKDDK